MAAFTNERETDAAGYFRGGNDTTRQTAVTPPGKGQASLGLLLLKTTSELYEDSDKRLKIYITINGVELRPPVTDLRFYGADFQTINSGLVLEANKRIEAGGEIILSVGLSRPWQKPGTETPYHWLQVNNIHFESQPFWRLGFVE